MKKYITVILFATLLFNSNVNAQSRGIKIGYIDMEYILEKTSSYAEAKNQLEQKAEKWKQEIEAKKSDIAKLKEKVNFEKENSATLCHISGNWSGWIGLHLCIFVVELQCGF